MLKILLATTFLRAKSHTPYQQHKTSETSSAVSVDVLYPISPPKLLLLPSNITLSVMLALVALPLSIPQSLASKRVITATGASLLTYMLWLACTAYSHATGNLDVSAGWVRMGALWDGISEFIPIKCHAWK